MVVGRSRSWTPCLNYESNSSKLQHDATAAATPCGVLVRTSTYTGTSCGVEVSKSVLFLMLEHLYGHRAGANVRYGRRAAGSRVRVLRGCSWASRASRRRWASIPAGEWALTLQNQQQRLSRRS